MLGGSGDFRANRHEYYSTDEEEDEGSEAGVQWENPGEEEVEGEEKKVPCSIVPRESNVVKVKNPFVSTLTPQGSSAEEDELVRRILGKISTALSSDEGDKEMVGEEVDMDVGKTVIAETTANVPSKIEQNLVNIKIATEGGMSARAKLWYKVVEEIGEANIEWVLEVQGIDQLSEDEWTDLLLRTVEASIAVDRRKENGGGESRSEERVR